MRPGQLHVAIVGAGSTGTELAAELYRTTREVIAYGLDRIDPERDIAHRADRGAPSESCRACRSGSPKRRARLLRPSSASRCAHECQVTRGDGAEGMQLADGAFIASELVVWAAGVKAPAVLAQLDGLEINRINQLVVEPTLQTTRDPDDFRHRRLRGMSATGRRRAPCRRGPRRRTSRRRTWPTRSSAACTARRLRPYRLP